MGRTRRGGGFLLLVLGTWLSLAVQEARAADPVLTPAVVTDTYGNSANSNSSISWAATPAGTPYKTDTSYNDGGLGPMFNFARSFINTAMGGSFPFEIATGLIQGTFNIGQEYMTIVNYAIGFAVCVVIGFLYLFIMPIVGCCFCCFRCCGACGGDMKRQRKDTDNCYRIAYSIVLAIATLFVFVGCLCVYVTNGQVATSMTSLQSSLDTNLDDLQLYLDNTVNEIQYLTSNNFNFTTSVINRDLDNIGYLVGVPVRDELNTKGGVEAAINSIMALDANISSAGSKLLAIDSSITTLKANAVTLTNDLAAAKADVDSGKGSCATSQCNALDSSLIAMDVDFNNLPDISSNVATMNSVLGRNLTALALDGKAQFDNIPQQVTTDTAAVVTQIKDLLASFSGTITSSVAPITSLPTQVGAPLGDIKTTLGNIWSQVTPYDTYRWAGGVALACIVLLVVVLQFVGVILGVFAYDDKREAHERSTVSHTAGQLLMSAAGFIFIFSWLLMLLTVILFLVGGLLEKAVCEPLADPQYTIFDSLFEPPNGIFGNSSFLGKTLLQDGSINLKFSDVLKGCGANGGAYTVLKLGSMFNLSVVTNYQSSIDIQSQIDAINVDLTTVDLISASTETQLNDFVSAVNINFNGFATVLSQQTVKTDLTTYASSLRAAAATTSGAAATSFNDAANKLDTINGGIFATVNGQQTQLKEDVAVLGTEVANVPTGVSTTISNANAVESYIGTNGTALIKTVAATYGNRILGSADSFASFALDQVTNYVGGCLPVYNLYQSIFVIGLCKYVVDVMNGFWFSLGWVLFFETISVIFDIKLAKYLRRMKTPEDDELFEKRSIGSSHPSLNEEPNVVMVGGAVGTAHHDMEMGHVDETKDGVDNGAFEGDGNAPGEVVEVVEVVPVGEPGPGERQASTASGQPQEEPNPTSPRPPSRQPTDLPGAVPDLEDADPPDAPTYRPPSRQVTGLGTPPPAQPTPLDTTPAPADEKPSEPN